MLSLKGMPHCKPSPTVREWVASFEEAVRRKLINWTGGGSVITAEHNHPELESAISNIESTVEGLSARLAGATGTVYNDLRARIVAIETVLEDLSATVQKIKDL